jgi:hypothetical protein
LSRRLKAEATPYAVCAFLGARCCAEFIAQYLKLAPEAYRFICEPGSYLHATLETELIKTMQKNGLIPKEWRQVLIREVERLAVETPDADFLTIDRVRRVFTKKEIDRFLEVIRK